MTDTKTHMLEVCEKIVNLGFNTPNIKSILLDKYFNTWKLNIKIQITNKEKQDHESLFEQKMENYRQERKILLNQLRLLNQLIRIILMIYKK